ncbi:hypothetical protein [Rufibacter psychrotolerans]|uniref:hypothetical protein n=1 Tax=Rufibacter psychrotolerans TaxID=2812556 RepID=UPI0019672789|nr:hypothetical protein [Rufibacter sp. SYSU D00308]
MKKILAMLSLGVLVAGTSFAQTVAPQPEGRKHRLENRHQKPRADRERKTPEQWAAARTARLDKQLDLSKAQEKKITALFLEQSKEREQLRANRQPGERKDPQLKASRKEAHAKWEAELQKILTKKQYATLEASRKEKRSQQETRGQRKGQDFKGREFRQKQNS